MLHHQAWGGGWPWTWYLQREPLRQCLLNDPESEARNGGTGRVTNCPGLLEIEGLLRILDFRF